MYMSALKELRENVTSDCQGPCKCQECKFVNQWYSVRELSATFLKIVILTIENSGQ